MEPDSLAAMWGSRLPSAAAPQRMAVVLSPPALPSQSPPPGPNMEHGLHLTATPRGIEEALVGGVRTAVEMPAMPFNGAVMDAHGTQLVQTAVETTAVPFAASKPLQRQEPTSFGVCEKIVLFRALAEVGQHCGS